MKTPVEDPRGQVAEMPPNTNASIDQNVRTTGQLSSPRDVHLVKDRDDVTSGDKYHLESIGASKTIIAIYDTSLGRISPSLSPSRP